MLQNCRPFQLRFILVQNINLKDVDADASSGDLCLLVHVVNDITLIHSSGG